MERHNSLLLGSTALSPARLAYYDGAYQAVVVPTFKEDGSAENLERPGADNLAMRDDWDQVDTILRGAKAIRQAGEKYLPKFEGETKERYTVRLSLSKFTNVYRDVVEGLASRPFEAPITLVETETDKAPDQIKAFIDDVDGARNSLTVFAAQTFFQGINDALDWIFVDYPNVPVGSAPRSVDAEKKAGIRPFWTHVRAINVLEARSTVISGSEELTYVRILEPNGGETDVRICYKDATGARWELWRMDRAKSIPGTAGNGVTIWSKVDEGIFSIGVIPLVPFITGRRAGRRFFVHPPMRDASDLQIELYWQESGLKNIKALAAFPMLTANGVTPDKNADGTAKPIVAGPMAVLYAPPAGNGQAGSWSLLEPGAQSMTFLAGDVKETIAQLRELGRNPLTAQSGTMTVISTAVAAKKGNSAVQMWAYSLEDALNNALYLTARWFGIDEATAREITCKVFTDFDIDANGADELGALRTARDKGDLSQRTYWKELTRRNVLSPDFDAEDEEQALLDEGPPDDGSQNDNIDPITGRANVVPIKPPVKQPTAG